MLPARRKVFSSRAYTQKVSTKRKKLRGKNGKKHKFFCVFENFSAGQRIFLIFTAPQSRSEYEYAVFPKKFFSSGCMVKRAGYTPESTPEKVRDLFLPKLTFTLTFDWRHAFTYSFTADKLRVFFNILLLFLIFPPFIPRKEKRWKHFFGRKRLIFPYFRHIPLAVYENRLTFLAIYDIIRAYS